MIRKVKPFVNIGPGWIIKREMEALNWSQEDLAEIIGMSPKSISQIINNKQSITVETAILLAKAFGSSPEFWLNLEQNYRLRLKEETDNEKETGIKAEIRKYMPVLEMKKKGWISTDKTAASQVKAYCRFWNLKTPGFKIYENDSITYCARQAKTDEKFTGYYMLTWLQKAKTEAGKIKTGSYSKGNLKRLSVKIPEMTLAEKGVGKFMEELNKTGIKTLILSHLSRTCLDGASFLDSGNPVVVYTGRYDRLDNFWRTMAHEIAHVLLHLNSGKDCFLDNLDEKRVTDKKEKDANALAGKLLHEKEILDKAGAYANYMSEDRLLEISEDCGIHPSVALGIMQYNGIVDYRTLTRYRKTVMDLIPGKWKRG